MEAKFGPKTFRLNPDMPSYSPTYIQSDELIVPMIDKVNTCNALMYRKSRTTRILRKYRKIRIIRKTLTWPVPAAVVNHKARTTSTTDKEITAASKPFQAQSLPHQNSRQPRAMNFSSSSQRKKLVKTKFEIPIYDGNAFSTIMFLV